MGMFERIVKEHVFIDFGSEVLYGDDRALLDRPVCFATVGFQLVGTALLEELIDRIRKDAGFTPFHPMDEYTEELCDQEGWYDFYIGLNNYDETKLDPFIEAVVCNSNAADDGVSYYIDLTPDEQNIIYEEINEQCRTHLGKSCDELLAEARKKMEDGM